MKYFYQSIYNYVKTNVPKMQIYFASQNDELLVVLVKFALYTGQFSILSRTKRLTV